MVPEGGGGVLREPGQEAVGRKHVHDGLAGPGREISRNFKKNISISFKGFFKMMIIYAFCEVGSD